MVYLLPVLSFTDLAHMIQEHHPQWIIKELRACTFPSRPEPKRALWIDIEEQPTVLFCYEPDPEVRYIVVFDAAIESFAQTMSFSDVVPSCSWQELRQTALNKSASYVDRWRAVAGWRARGQYATSAQGALGKEHTEHEFDTSFELLGCALTHEDALIRQITAAQLEIWGEPRFKEMLKDQSYEEPELHARLLMRRALDKIDRQEILAHTTRRGRRP